MASWRLPSFAPHGSGVVKCAHPATHDETRDACGGSLAAWLRPAVRGLINYELGTPVRTMRRAWLFLGVLSVGFASEARPCSVVSIASATELVERAQVIVKARAERLSDAPGEGGTLGGSPTQVVFTVLEVLKGDLSEREVRFNGHLEPQDDANDKPVPRNFVRPGGRRGNCFALGYRAGGEYLLFLNRARERAYAQRLRLTPYWAPLAATNDQLFGSSDPWLTWVRRALAKNGVE